MSVSSAGNRPDDVRRFARPYTLTGGRTRSRSANLTLDTQILANSSGLVGKTLMFNVGAQNLVPLLAIPWLRRVERPAAARPAAEDAVRRPA